MAVSHYQRLGVSPHATHDEIKKAYHRLALLHHPDANPGGEGDTRLTMADINAAWAVLSVPEKRRSYDYAIGTTPRPRSTARFPHEHDDDDDIDDLAHLYDEPDAVPRRARPADLVMMIPVLLLLTALGTFFLSAMSEHEGMRTAAILLAPVTAGSFVAAPLFTMLRARGRDRQ